MMGGGIGFSAAGIFPEVFIAVFYTGLGCAFALAGIAIAAKIYVRQLLSILEQRRKNNSLAKRCIPVPKRCQGIIQIKIGQLKLTKICRFQP